MFNFERKWSDYVYSAEEISTFKGKKFSGQRNHINKFRSLYGEPDFRPMKPEFLPQINEMLDLYAKEHPSDAYEENEEFIHTKELLAEFFDFGGIFDAPNYFFSHFFIIAARNYKAVIAGHINDRIISAY